MSSINKNSDETWGTFFFILFVGIPFFGGVVPYTIGFIAMNLFEALLYINFNRVWALLISMVGAFVIGYALFLGLVHLVSALFGKR